MALQDLTLKGRVAQNNYQAIGVDDVEYYARLNRRGELVTPALVQSFVSDGRVFHASNPAKQTADAVGSTSYSDTQPAWILDVPTNTSVLLLEFQAKQGGTVAGDLTTYLLTVDTIVRYSSGGTTAPTIYNMLAKTTQVRASLCTVYKHGATPLVAAATSTQETISGGEHVADVDALAGGHIFYSTLGSVSPWLIGPASLGIYAYAGTTGPSYFWSLKWAEMPSTSVV